MITEVNKLKLVEVIRKTYWESRIGREIEDQHRIQKNLLWYASKFGISETLILMGEDVYNELKLPVIEYYINKE